MDLTFGPVQDYHREWAREVLNYPSVKKAIADHQAKYPNLPVKDEDWTCEGGTCDGRSDLEKAEAALIADVGWKNYEELNKIYMSQKPITKDDPWTGKVFPKNSLHTQTEQDIVNEEAYHLFINQGNDD